MAGLHQAAHVSSPVACTNEAGGEPEPLTEWLKSPAKDVTLMEDVVTLGKTRLTAPACLAVLVAVWIPAVTMPQFALLAITLLSGIAPGAVIALAMSGKWVKSIPERQATSPCLPHSPNQEHTGEKPWDAYWP